MRCDPWVLFNGNLYTLGLERYEANILILSIIILFVVDYIRYRKGERIDAFLQKQNLWFRWIAIIVFICVILVYGKYGPDYDVNQFIYFQF